eukprot:7681794-Karenia_brevis.AAC.1
MDDLPHLDYLDGRPSPFWITWMYDYHCLHYLDGEASLPALPGWTTFTAWSTLIPGWTTFTHLDKISRIV